MPTYDYQCRSCGAITEVIHAMTADGPTVCEQCGGELRRVLYPAGIIFKGSGFYRTDSRAGSGASGSSPSPSPSGASATSGAKDSPSAGDGTGSASAAASSVGSTESGGSKPPSSGSGGESAG